MNNNTLVFIGEVSSPYKSIDACPRNVSLNDDFSTLHIYEEYKKGLFALEKSQKILILYWLDQIPQDRRHVDITTSRGGGDELYGTFAIRTPYRPNPIGIAELEIADITENSILVQGLDCLDGTKLIDIKPVLKNALKRENI